MENHSYRKWEQIKKRFVTSKSTNPALYSKSVITLVIVYLLFSLKIILLNGRIASGTSKKVGELKISTQYLVIISTLVVETCHSPRA